VNKCVQELTSVHEEAVYPASCV